MSRRLRTPWTLSAVAALALSASAAEPSPREIMREGRAKLDAGDLPAAAAAFDRAATAAPGAQLDPARARFNQGLALQQQDGKDAEAEAALDQALRTTDARLQSRTYYNRGHLLSGRAKALQQAQKLPEAQSAAGQALSAFADSLLLASSDNDSRVNYEMTQRLIEELEQQVEQQKQQQPDPQQKQDPQPKQEPQSQQDPQPKQEPQPQSQPQPQDPPQDGSQQEQQKSEPSGMNEDTPSPADPGEEKPEDMSKEEATMLLDAMKAEEAAMREKLRLRLGRPVPVDKDW